MIGCAVISRVLKKSLYSGCSKTRRCKARAVSDTCLQAIVRNEAYFSYAAVTNNECNAADVRFSTAC